MAIARKLRDLATDAVVLPTKLELYERHCAKLTDAKSKLAAIVARQIQVEKTVNGTKGNTDAIVAEKRAAEATVARLEHEGGLLKQTLIDARPKRLTPQQQHWADVSEAVAGFDPYSRCGRGSPEQIASAQADLDKLVVEYRLNPPTGNAGESWRARKNAAETRLAALQGPPYAPHRPWASDDVLKAARKAEGFKN
jgi:hypothetical protein